eukprot:TRINITY_DN3573_c0_g1_i5.p3 TRINITY_DN3573_c0_g1~~TRINITY_DN3573_c0_g1_i5.p3  ORF type:complete len:191 (+),score=51.98 TRINITY_DN3573_c0_g1_i5:733-1305(+)
MAKYLESKGEKIEEFPAVETSSLVRYHNQSFSQSVAHFVSLGVALGSGKIGEKLGDLVQQLNEEYEKISFLNEEMSRNAADSFWRETARADPDYLTKPDGEWSKTLDSFKRIVKGPAAPQSILEQTEKRASEIVSAVTKAQSQLTALQGAFAATLPAVAIAAGLGPALLAGTVGAATARALGYAPRNPFS